MERLKELLAAHPAPDVFRTDLLTRLAQQHRDQAREGAPRERQVDEARLALKTLDLITMAALPVDHPDALLMLRGEASVLLGHLTDDAEAAAAGVAAWRTLAHDHPESDFVGPALLALGEEYLSEEQAIRAIMAFGAARNPRWCTHPCEADLGLARAWWQMGEPGETLEFLAPILTREAHTVPARRLRRRALELAVEAYLGAGELDEACEFESALVDPSERERFHDLLSTGYAAKGVDVAYWFAHYPACQWTRTSP